VGDLLDWMRKPLHAVQSGVLARIQATSTPAARLGGVALTAPTFGLLRWCSRHYSPLSARRLDAFACGRSLAVCQCLEDALILEGDDESAPTTSKVPSRLLLELL
jgi:hypothetical protein